MDTLTAERSYKAYKIRLIAREIRGLDFLISSYHQRAINSSLSVIERIEAQSQKIKLRKIQLQFIYKYDLSMNFKIRWKE